VINDGSHSSLVIHKHQSAQCHVCIADGSSNSVTGRPLLSEEGKRGELRKFCDEALWKCAAKISVWTQLTCLCVQASSAETRKAANQATHSNRPRCHWSRQQPRADLPGLAFRSATSRVRHHRPQISHLQRQATALGSRLLLCRQPTTHHDCPASRNDGAAPMYATSPFALRFSMIPFIRHTTRRGRELRGDG